MEHYILKYFYIKHSTYRDLVSPKYIWKRKTDLLQSLGLANIKIKLNSLITSWEGLPPIKTFTSSQLHPKGIWPKKLEGPSLQPTILRGSGLGRQHRTRCPLGTATDFFVPLVQFIKWELFSTKCRACHRLPGWPSDGGLHVSLMLHLTLAPPAIRVKGSSYTVPEHSAGIQ